MPLYYYRYKPIHRPINFPLPTVIDAVVNNKHTISIFCTYFTTMKIESVSVNTLIVIYYAYIMTIYIRIKRMKLFNWLMKYRSTFSGRFHV